MHNNASSVMVTLLSCYCFPPVALYNYFRDFWHRTNDEKSLIFLTIIFIILRHDDSTSYARLLFFPLSLII